MCGFKQRVEEFISRYNWLWKQIVRFVISYFYKFWWLLFFEKQTRKKLSLKTKFKIEFFLPFIGRRKVLEKKSASSNDSLQIFSWLVWLEKATSEFSIFEKHLYDSLLTRILEYTLKYYFKNQRNSLHAISNGSITNGSLKRHGWVITVIF